MREKLTKFELAAELGTNPLACNFGGGGGGGTTTQTTVQKSEPWEGQKPYLTDVYQQAKNLYQTHSPNYYPYSTVAPYDPFRTMADSLIMEAAPASLSMMNQGRQGLTSMLGAVDVLQNPFFGGALQATIDPVVRTYQREILPSITSTAEELGVYSNTRLPQVKAQAAQDAFQAMLNTAAQFGSTAYGQGLQAAGQAASMIPNYMQAAFLPVEMFSQAGAARQAQTQAEIDDAVKRFEFYQRLPYAKLAEYANTVGGNSPGGTTFAESRTSGGNSGLATMLMLLPFML